MLADGEDTGYPHFPQNKGGQLIGVLFRLVWSDLFFHKVTYETAPFYDFASLENKYVFFFFFFRV